MPLNFLKWRNKLIILFLLMNASLVNKHLKNYNLSIRGKNWEFQCQKFQNSINLIAEIISKGTYFVRLSHLNTSSEVFEEFFLDLKKYITSKKYLDDWQLSFILDNASYHKTKKIFDKLIEMRVNVWYLPPYTPQFQPVETFFGITKSKLRELKLSNWVRLDTKEGEILVENTLRSISPASIIKCFNKAIINIQNVLN